MKKKLLSILLLATMVAAMFVGCGDANDTNTETTNDTTENTEVVENTEGINLIPNTEETPTFSDDMSWIFPSGMEGFTDKWIYSDDETWSLNGTHYVAKNGNVMDFKWEGPVELGEKASEGGGKTLCLEDKNDNYMLLAWGSILDSMDGAIKHYDKETIVTVNSFTTYKEGDYYKLYDEETYDKVIFKVSGTIHDVDYTGYACYMDDYATMTTYQFIYLERVDMFDDERALSVAESLDFWDMEIVE